MWDPERDACDFCKECKCFYRKDWEGCDGDFTPCLDFSPKKGSKYKIIEVEIENDKLS